MSQRDTTDLHSVTIYIHSKGMKLVFVNPYHVKQSKEMSEKDRSESPQDHNQTGDGGAVSVSLYFGEGICRVGRGHEQPGTYPEGTERNREPDPVVDEDLFPGVSERLQTVSYCQRSDGAGTGTAAPGYYCAGCGRYQPDLAGGQAERCSNKEGDYLGKSYT